MELTRRICFSSFVGDLVRSKKVSSKTSKITKRAFYSAAPERANDLIHVKLDVAFDWKKKQLLGTAYLELKPYFYHQNTLVLDAKGFDLHRVALVNEIDFYNPLTHLLHPLTEQKQDYFRIYPF